MSEEATYTVHVSPAAERDMERLDRIVARRIVNRIRWLADHADQIPHDALKGSWSGLYRIRSGDYRIIYDLMRETRDIVIVRVGHRREVYGD